jgi:DNA-binding response OmpR family regulator
LNSGAVAEPQSDDSTAVRVLIADPDKSLLAMYREVLPGEGFEVVTAPSGLECIARLRERVPDVLVLDPQLPWGGADGVLAMMCEGTDLAIVPVMVLMSCRDPLVLGNIAQFPITDWHVKPLAPDRLAKMLRNLLDHHRLRSKLAKQKRFRRSFDQKSTAVTNKGALRCRLIGHPRASRS